MRLQMAIRFSSMSLHDACYIEDMDGPENDGKQLCYQLEAFRCMVSYPLLKLYND